VFENCISLLTVVVHWILQIHLSHSCGTKYVGAINKQLIAEENLYIQGTCFGWFTLMKEFTQIPKNLLSKLCMLSEKEV